MLVCRPVLPGLFPMCQCYWAHSHALFGLSDTRSCSPHKALHSSSAAVGAVCYRLTDNSTNRLGTSMLNGTLQCRSISRVANGAEVNATRTNLFAVEVQLPVVNGAH